MTVAAPSQSGYGELLRGWRQQRRFSQLELATLADVSSRHVSFLETGRARPSREMVLHLADYLDVPLREQNELLLAAGYAPAYPTRHLEEAAMQPATEALDMILAAHEPYPAIIIDRHWNLVSANAAALLLTSRVDAALLAPPVNVIRISVHPNGLAPHIANFAEYAHHLVARLRRQLEHTADAELEDLLAETLERCGPALLEQSTRGESVVLPLHLQVGGNRLALFSTVAVFGAPQEVTLAELAIETFYPADQATAAILRTWSTD